ncbi:calponin homology domain-containing protein [Naematelia encephala]|uniref:Calponin homology domain-containing protein n=1 Tax=Naematelia encephala TaxID=71784 RepID=A0A1Y2B620_9TREE|nr:calponin homology domain-containing protein [Naematelia encephala]
MSVYVGESRGELLAWLNDLLAPNDIKKLEQCGTGAVYCQVIDSIYGDLPMHRVKFNAKMEYEYLDNFKVLQKAFKQHQIDKPIPVDRLVKCKMQDNLEFLQWMKKYWDMHSRGDEYDATARANGATITAPPSSRPTPTARPAASSSARAPSAAAPRAPSATSSARLTELTGQVNEMQAHCLELEKERDFYFDKLRNIELIVQERAAIDGIEQSERDVLSRVQEILYSTTDGFEVPENGNDVPAEEPLADEEEETF